MGKEIVTTRDVDAIALKCAEICEEYKGESVLLYDVRTSSSLADYYLVATGTSEPHLRALHGYLDKAMAEQQVALKKVSGTPASHWIVLDFGNVIVHLFTQQLRDYYRLESLWSDSQVVYRSHDLAPR